MKKMIVIGVVGLVLGSFQNQATAQQEEMVAPDDPQPASRCMDGQKLENHLTERLVQMNYDIDALRSSLATRRMHIKVGRKSKATPFNRDVIYEQFLSPSEGKKVFLIPGLGFSLNVSSESILYICADFSPGDVVEPAIKISFLERPKRFIPIIPGRRGVIQLSNKNLEFSVINSVDGLIHSFGIPLIPDCLSILLAPIKDVAQHFIGTFVAAGVTDVIVTPHKVTAYTGFKVLNGFISPKKSFEFDYDSSWLLQDL